MPIPSCKLPDPAVLYKELAHDGIAIYIREAFDYLTSGDAKSCINHFNHAVAKDVASPWEWIVAATAHCQLGNYKMAIEVSKKDYDTAVTIPIFSIVWEWLMQDWEIKPKHSITSTKLSTRIPTTAIAS